MIFNEDIAQRARLNPYFREVLATGDHSQVVVMCIPPGGEIGEEVHEGVDQVLTFVDGQGEAILDGVSSAVGPGRLVLRAGRHAPQLRQHRRDRPASLHDLRAAGARPRHDPSDEGRGRRRRARGRRRREVNAAST